MPVGSRRIARGEYFYDRDAKAMPSDATSDDEDEALVAEFTDMFAVVAAGLQATGITLVVFLLARFGIVACVAGGACAGVARTFLASRQRRA